MMHMAEYNQLDQQMIPGNPTVIAHEIRPATMVVSPEDEHIDCMQAGWQDIGELHRKCYA